ncbi:MAG: F0F1 ATP synthase subunit epsilon [Acidocella sp.]|uniref:F0F1 ATP synthase subunit epsilon n=1 Tax=Acidocella sp. TaxID=50710 RepID=UPI003FC6DD15
MRLRITTPLAMLVDEEGVLSLRAEDMSGGFGILPGHAEFLTSLVISLVSWKLVDGGTRHCAVRGGILTVTGGQEIGIATREGVLGDDLATLHQDILARFQNDEEAERVEHIAQAQLHLSAIRQIMRHLRPQGRDGGAFP